MRGAILLALVTCALALSGCILEDDECPENEEPYTTGTDGGATWTPSSYHGEDYGDYNEKDCPRDSEPY